MLHDLENWILSIQVKEKSSKVGLRTPRSCLLVSLINISPIRIKRMQTKKLPCLKPPLSIYSNFFSKTSISKVKQTFHLTTTTFLRECGYGYVHLCITLFLSTDKGHKAIPTIVMCTPLGKRGKNSVQPIKNLMTPCKGTMKKNKKNNIFHHVSMNSRDHLAHNIKPFYSPLSC